MKLFFKHLLNSTKSRPTEPLILLFTMMLSVCFSVSVLTLRSAISDERHLSEAAAAGSADIEISLNSSSDPRFMFKEDLLPHLPEGSVAVGYYEIIMTDPSGDMYTSAAVDFREIGGIFQIEFSSYLGVSEDKREYSAFVSSDLAKKRGIGLGEKFTSSLLGGERVYTVSGISEVPLLGKFDCLIDIGGAVKLLSENSPFAASLGENFRPSSRLFVDLPDSSDMGAVISAIKSDEHFSDRDVQETAGGGYSEGNLRVLSAIINFAVLVSCIMTAVCTYGCFSILSRERREENYAFFAAGARPGLLIFMQYAEAFVYWIFGSAFGLLISYPAGALLSSLAGFEYASLEPTPAVFLSASGSLLFAVLLSVSLFVFSKEKKPSGKGGKIFIILDISLALILYALTYLLPLEYKIYTGLLSGILILLGLFLTADLILFALLWHLSRRKEKKLKQGKGSPLILYSQKNLLGTGALSAALKTLTLFIAAALSVSYILNSLSGNVYIASNIFCANHIVMNATDRCRERLEECDGISSVESIYFSEAEYSSGIKTNLISVSDINILGEPLGIKHQPKGKAAVISETEARAHSLKIGDSFSVKVGGREIELCLSETVSSGLIFILFDSEYFGIEHTALMPIGSEGVTDSELLSELSYITADEAAAVIRSDSLTDNILDSVMIYVRSGNAMLLFMAFFSLFGIVNVLYECYRSRRAEFSVYHSAGMSEKKIRKMKRCELFTISGFALILGGAGFLLAIPVIGETLFANCYGVHENFSAWLGSIFA